MKMVQILEFDCRTICEGRKCPHLHPNNNLKLASIVKMFTCKDKHLVIIPEIKNPGNITEEIISISPFNTCIQMRKLQSEGLAQWAEYSISPDGIGTHWNPPLKAF
jgi:hypothetical protein